MFEGTIEEVAAAAEALLASIAPGAFCVPQSWDARIDCFLRLPDGSIIGEMVSADELTEGRLRATGERLQKRAESIAAGQRHPASSEISSALMSAMGGKLSLPNCG